MENNQKAEELISKFLHLVDCGDNRYITKVQLKNAKSCALITVNEIIEQWEYIDTFIGNYGGELNPNLRYWQQVKQHIEEYGK